MLQMVFMLLGIFRADNDIIHICLSKNLWLGPQPLKSGSLRGICQTKRKHLELVMAKGSSKDGLWAIFRSKSDLMVSSIGFTHTGAEWGCPPDASSLSAP